MNTPLYNQIVTALKTLHQQGERIIDSADVYRLLGGAGAQAPDGAIGAVFTELVERGAISVSHYMDMSGTKRHGSLIITITSMAKL